MIVIDRKAPWIQELVWLAAWLAELGHEREAIITREYLHSMVGAIDDEQETSMMVERQVDRSVEAAVATATVHANRELGDIREWTMRCIVEVVAHVAIDCRSDTYAGHGRERDRTKRSSSAALVSHLLARTNAHSHITSSSSSLLLHTQA